MIDHRELTLDDGKITGGGDVVVFLLDLVDFGIKVGLVALATGIVFAFLASFFRRDSGMQLGQMSVVSLSDHHRSMRNMVARAVMTEKEYKDDVKKEKKADKEPGNENRKRVFVVDFQGDIAATALSELREQVTVLLDVLREGDEVVLTLESGGGMVHDYGLASSQLVRLRDAGFPLTICVDKIAASGGYMMAATGTRILAAPFAIIGSVGVLMMMPNFSRFLKKHDIDYLELTAGEYKHTLSAMGEITEKGINKSQEELELTHDLFKNFVGKHRPQLELAQIGTGEIWYGTSALELKLVDELITSDQYLHQLSRGADIYKLIYEVNKSVKERLAGAFSKVTEETVMRLWTRLEERRRIR